VTTKSHTGPRLVLQPASRPAARSAGSGALNRFFAIADAWELSPLRVALLANIQHSLQGKAAARDHAWAWLNAPQRAAPFAGDSPLYFMLENGLPALREVARLLVRESARR
jgi:hypothetical protein